ncbi:MAG: ABC transporter permease subunit [Oscillospiraceae bacterium]|nr:ABC transporter permease subunit [Oscillospiraceae bacterium]
MFIKVKPCCIFLKKELFEAAKTFKMLIMGIVFVIFGMLSPLTAKMMPQIMQWALESDPSSAGMINATAIPEPVALDSWAQFISNITQMGMIVLVIVFSGMLSSELSKGTLTMILTKGISRADILLSKLTSAAIIWTGSLSVSFLTCLGYTAYFFEESLPNLLSAAFCLWLSGMFLLALTALFAALTKKGYICMILVGASSVVLQMLNMIPKVSRYNPATLSSFSLAHGVITGETAAADFYPTLIVSGAFTLIITAAAVIVFNKRKL